MKHFKLLIFVSIVLISTTTVAFSEEPTTKETAIEALIKIENENKALHLGTQHLDGFSKAIDGEDRLNCFEKRCVNERQLKIKISGELDNTPIYVDLGGHAETIDINPSGNLLEFKGTLGNHYVGQIWANACYNRRLTKLVLRNNGHGPVKISTVEMLLDNGNGVEKSIFRVEQPFNLTSGQKKSYTMAEIKNNPIWQSAKVASCRD